MVGFRNIAIHGSQTLDAGIVEAVDPHLLDLPTSSPPCQLTASESGAPLAVSERDRRPFRPSGERELVARPHHHPRHGALDPARARRQHDGGGPHEEGPRVARPARASPCSRSARAAVIRRWRTWMIAVSLVPEALLACGPRCVALALLHGLVLHAEAGDAAVHPRAVRPPSP